MVKLHVWETAVTEVLLALSDLPVVPALLIRISREWRGGLSQEQLYERVRRYWRIRPERRATPPQLAYGVGDGVIRAVFAITGWETYDMAVEAKRSDRLDLSPHGRGERIGFVGEWCDDLAYLVGARLVDPPKGQNPVTYLHC